MTANDFIPVGRTSLVKKGEVALQVQTEYASRPNPRITTSILNNGRLLHKVERTLENPVTTPEEQLRIEATIKRQHSEILAIIEGRSYSVPSSDHAAPNGSAADSRTPLSEQLAAIPGVQKVFQIDGEGKFVGASASEEFRRMFSVIFQSLRELLELFTRLPGVGMTREKGVYEVERDRLYMLSAGIEFYFVLVRRVDVTTNYEKTLKAFTSDSPF